MPITTLSLVKGYLPDAPSIDDDFITLLIGMVGESIENYCHRKFGKDTYREKHIINHVIFTNQTPITRVISIKRYLDMSSTGLDSLLGEENYRVFPSYIDLLDYKSLSMTNKLMYRNSEESCVEIEYEAGYDNVPSDIALAAIKWVALEYKESREERLGVDSDSEGTVKRTYTKRDSDIPLSILPILDRYKKVRI